MQVVLRSSKTSSFERRYHVLKVLGWTGLVHDAIVELEY